MKTTMLIVAMMLSGCATCERHPVYCSAGVGILATSVALSVHHADDRSQDGLNFPEHRR